MKKKFFWRVGFLLMLT